MENITKNKPRSRFAKLIADTLGTDVDFWDNEIQGNQMVSRVLLINLIVMVLTEVLNDVGLFTLNKKHLHLLTLFIVLVMAVMYLFCRLTKCTPKYLRLVMLFALVICDATIDSMLCYNATLIMVIPVILSVRYYNRKLTAFISGLSGIVFMISAYIGARFGMLDLNHVTLAKGTVIYVNETLTDGIKAAGYDVHRYVINTMLRNFLPRYMIYIIIAIICTEIAEKGYQMIVHQNKTAREHGRIESELNVASAIQKGTLSRTMELEEHPSFELSANMRPAKEVAGDFYDFVRIDENHLVLIIADVSGKGVPAAMFMMVSKLLLDINVEAGRGPADVLTQVNHRLCVKNLEDMFVTVWLGIIDLSTGVVTASNAGHEYPLIARGTEPFAAMKKPHSPALGVMDGIRYREYQFQLNPGDTLFLYTDGVTEANDAQEQFYGLERTCKVLTRFVGENVETLLQKLVEDIDLFADKASQFDDITMMGFRLNSLLEVHGLQTAITENTVSEVQQYLESEMERQGASLKEITRMNVAEDEICSNIVNYSQASWVYVSVEVTDEHIRMEFRDNGIPFDPLRQEEPDITETAEERKIGGLGIFMVRKLMDGVYYSYENECNHILLTLNRRR